MTDDTFTCFNCEREFVKGWTNEDSEAEYEQMYGKHIGEERVLLCDDCHERFMTWLAKNKKDIVQ